MRLSIILFSAFTITWPPTVSALADQTICYYGNWSQWRPGISHITSSDVDTNTCTHVVYKSVEITGNGRIRLTSNDLDFIEGFERLRRKIPALKLIITIGDASASPISFSRVAADANLRKALLSDAIKLSQQYRIDGFNVEWQLPSGPSDKFNFVRLLEEFRVEFKKYEYTLIASVSPNTEYYNVPGIVKSLDLLIILTCDSDGSSVTGNDSSDLDAVYVMNKWITDGAPPNKLVILICTHGTILPILPAYSASNNNIGNF